MFKKIPHTYIHNRNLKSVFFPAYPTSRHFLLQVAEYSPPLCADFHPSLCCPPEDSVWPEQPFHQMNKSECLKCWAWDALWLLQLFIYLNSGWGLWVFSPNQNSALAVCIGKSSKVVVGCIKIKICSLTANVPLCRQE